MYIVGSGVKRVLSVLSDLSWLPQDSNALLVQHMEPCWGQYIIRVKSSHSPSSEKENFSSRIKAEYLQGIIWQFKQSSCRKRQKLRGAWAVLSISDALAIRAQAKWLLFTCITYLPLLQNRSTRCHLLKQKEVEPHRRYLLCVSPNKAGADQKVGYCSSRFTKFTAWNGKRVGQGIIIQTG